jgi:alginate O-acetyltransferase complex protein AlgI
MVFASVIFTFGYLPIFLLFYFAVTFLLGKLPTALRYTRNILILLFSVLFYFWGEKLLVLVMLSSTIVDYIAGIVISGQWNKKGAIEALEKGGSRTAGQKLALTLSITTNLLLLGFFKYFNFFVDSINMGLSSMGFGPEVIQVWQIALPLGISFYTFQSMSYTIDVFRGETPATRNFVDFACYVTLFPQLVAGPIIRYKTVADQLVNRITTFEDFSIGVQRFAIGLGKKLLIADVLARPADMIFAIPQGQLTTELAWFCIFIYSLQVYFDFSGYSDMAIGLGRMMGFRFLENFNYPLICQSLREFWRRWHISLSTWLRDYLYIPMGGNQVSPVRLYFNLFTVFILCGLWHGASWMFFFWGIWHGIFLTLERIGLGKWLESIPRPFRHVYAQLVLAVHWVMFRIQDVDHAIDFNASLFGFGGSNGGVYNIPLYLTGPVVIAIVFGILGAFPFWPWLHGRINAGINRLNGSALIIGQTAYSTVQVAGIMAILLLSGSFMSATTYSPFIYFRF